MNGKMTLADIRAALVAGGINAAKAIDELTGIIDSSTDDSEKEQALTLRGEQYWKFDRRADAINDYNAAIALNPASQAVKLKENAYAILDFYNKDLYNP